MGSYEVVLRIRTIVCEAWWVHRARPNLECKLVQAQRLPGSSGEHRKPCATRGSRLSLLSQTVTPAVISKMSWRS